MADYQALLTPNIVGSFPQETDYIYQAAPGPFADRIDLKPDVYEVDDQLSIGSCTANAVTSQLEALLKRDGRGVSLSRFFNYWASRSVVLEQPGIEGSTTRAAIRAAKHLGSCRETTWPYDISKANVRPSDESFTEASGRLIQRYEMIDARVAEYPPVGDLTQEEWWALILKIATEKIVKAVKSALNEGLPVSFSCGLGQMWMNLTGPWQAHVYPAVTPNGINPRIGGHAMLVIGYDDSCQRFLIENSWGPQWGDGGFGGMPYESFGMGLMEAFVVRGFDGIYVNDPLQSQWDTIQRLYLGFYQRPADLGGILYWRDRLIKDGLSAIVEAFMTSVEAQVLYSESRMNEANRATRRNI